MYIISIRIGGSVLMRAPQYRFYLIHSDCLREEGTMFISDTISKDPLEINHRATFNRTVNRTQKPSMEPHCLMHNLRSLKRMTIISE